MICHIYSRNRLENTPKNPAAGSGDTLDDSSNLAGKAPEGEWTAKNGY